MIVDEMVGWHHQLTGDSEGQGSLVCYSSWGCKELDTTEHLNINKKIKMTLMLLPHLRPPDSVFPGWGQALVFPRSSPE